MKVKVQKEAWQEQQDIHFDRKSQRVKDKGPEDLGLLQEYQCDIKDSHGEAIIKATKEESLVDSPLRSEQYEHGGHFYLHGLVYARGHKSGQSLVVHFQQSHCVEKINEGEDHLSFEGVAPIVCEMVEKPI